jgi:hypothetical protein
MVLLCLFGCSHFISYHFYVLSACFTSNCCWKYSFLIKYAIFEYTYTSSWYTYSIGSRCINKHRHNIQSQALNLRILRTACNTYSIHSRGIKRHEHNIQNQRQKTRLIRILTHLLSSPISNLHEANSMSMRICLQFVWLYVHLCV